MTDSDKRIFGLVGYPLGHSFSRGFFSRKFSEEEINAEYLNFEIDSIKKIKGIINEYLMLEGFNVTIPYKQQIIPYLTSIDPLAEKIGAVNVVKVIHHLDSSVELRGFNSDIIGFSESLRPLLVDVKTCKSLVLGTGGASKAVVIALKEMGYDVILVSRNAGESKIAYSEITPELMAEVGVIVNTTPLGMYPKVDAAPPIPYESIRRGTVCFDLVYNPETTLFMKLAAENGAIVKNGLEMLHLQAIASWNIWSTK